MTDDEIYPCPVCGTPISPHTARCPNGHDLYQTTADFQDVWSDEGDESSEYEAAVDRNANTLFECSSCNNLSETQYEGQRTVEPRYCPWCGNAVSSLLGREIDGYRLDSVIARGGFGIIYLASNITSDTMKAVVKFMRPELAYRRPELVRVFVEEARLTEEIGQTCWNVVRVFNVRETPWPYYFTEYIRGTSLHNRIAKASSEKIPLAECKGYLRGVAKALAATHEKGRVHRDLKPLNLMLMESGEISHPEDRVKLLDFGLSLRIARAKDHSRYSRGRSGEARSSEPYSSPFQTAGTPEYMPPEAFDGINEYSGDIYSFGVTAYEILTGQGPWPPPSPAADRFLYWREAHKKIPPRPIRELRSEVPPWLAKVIMRCLEKNSRQRVASAKVLQDRLRDPIPSWVWSSSAAALLLLAFLVWLAFFTTVPLSIEYWRGGRMASRELFERADTDGSGDLSRDEWNVQRQRLRVVPGAKVHGWSDFGEHRTKDGRLTLQEFVETGEVASWPMDRDTPELWVKSASDLTALRASGSMPKGKKLRSLTTRPDAGLAEIDEHGGVELSFAEHAALPRSALVVVGEGDGFRLQASLTIRHDNTVPIVSSLRVVEGGRSLPMKDGVRLRSRVSAAKLEAVIEEKNIARVFLEMIPLDDPTARSWPTPLEGHLEANDGAATYSFPLENTTLIEETRYRARVVAVDLAANESSSDPVEFRIDDSVKVSFVGKPYLTKSNAYYEFKAEERIAKIEVSDRQEQNWKVIRKPPMQNSLDLARHLDGGVQPVDPNQVGLRESYLLELPLEGALAEAKFRVEVSDEAENTQVYELDFRSPDRLGRDDIHVSMRFGEDEGYTPLFRGDENDDLVFRLKHPTNRLLVEALRVSFERGRVHQATCRVAGRRFAVRPQFPDHAIFDLQKLRLRAGDGPVSNPIELTLLDPLERASVVKVVVEADSEPPKLEPVKENLLPYSQVRDWNDIQLSLRSSEQLLEAPVCTIKPPARSGSVTEHRRVRAESAGKTAWTLPLADMNGKPIEGRYEVTVDAKDLASNSGTLEFSFDVNQRQPEVKPLNLRKEGSRYVIEREEILFHISDRNGLKLSEIQVSYRRDGDTGSERVDYEPPSARDPYTTNLKVSLRQIPPRSAGTLFVRVTDRLGLETRLEVPFDFHPRIDWRDEVRWLDLVWVRFETSDERVLYVTKYEISNKVFRHPRLFGPDGAYLEERLRRNQVRPKYWAPDGGFPVFRKRDGTTIPGDDFPIVGVSWEAAETFAREVCHGDLPTWSEWRDAAWRENRGGRYPWKNVPEGELVCNLHDVWNRADSPFSEYQAHDPYMYPKGRPRVQFMAVQVAFDPFQRLSEEVRKKLKYSGEILHLLGNVSEFVRYDGSRYVAGGDFKSRYSHIDLKEDEPNLQRYTGPSAKIGFRVVIDIDKAHPDFRSEARPNPRSGESTP